MRFNVSVLVLCLVLASQTACQTGEGNNSKATGIGQTGVKSGTGPTSKIQTEPKPPVRTSTGSQDPGTDNHGKGPHANPNSPPSQDKGETTTKSGGEIDTSAVKGGSATIPATVLPWLAWLTLIGVAITLMLALGNRFHLRALKKRALKADNLGDLDQRFTRIESYLEQLRRDAGARVATPAVVTSDLEAKVRSLSAELETAKRELERTRQELADHEHRLQISLSKAQVQQDELQIYQQFFHPATTPPRSLDEALTLLVTAPEKLNPADAISAKALKTISLDAHNLQSLHKQTLQIGFVPSRSGNYRPVTMPLQQLPVCAVRDAHVVACSTILEWCRSQLLRRIEEVARTRVVLPSRGDAFDARLHEADKYVIADDPAMAGRIATCLEMGFEGHILARVERYRLDESATEPPPQPVQHDSDDPPPSETALEPDPAGPEPILPSMDPLDKLFSN